MCCQQKHSNLLADPEYTSLCSSSSSSSFNLGVSSVLFSQVLSSSPVFRLQPWDSFPVLVPVQEHLATVEPGKVCWLLVVRYLNYGLRSLFTKSISGISQKMEQSFIGKEFVSLSGYVWRETVSNGLPVDDTVESFPFSLLESANIDILIY